MTTKEHRGTQVNYVETMTEAVDEATGDELDEDLLRLYALLALVKGPAVSNADVHDAWSLWRSQARPHHESIVPFAQLDQATQDKDTPYRDAIIAAARTFDED